MEKLQNNLFKNLKNVSLKDKFNLFVKIPTLFWFFDYENNIDTLILNTSLIGFILSLLILIIGSGIINTI
jgi:hypothetical protein